MNGNGIALSFLIVLLSELIALFLIFRLWRSDEHLFLKVLFSVIATLPILGPFLVIWSTNVPSPQHPSTQDKSTYRADVHDRWAHVFSQSNPVLKYRYWKRVRHPEDEEKE